MSKWIFRLVAAVIVTYVLLHIFCLPVSAQKVPCTAHYSLLTPNELVGWDECGHIWKLILPTGLQSMPDDSVSARGKRRMGVNETDTAICVHWNAKTGVFRELECPKPGEITGMREE